MYFSGSLRGFPQPGTQDTSRGMYFEKISKLSTPALVVCSHLWPSLTSKPTAKFNLFVSCHAMSAIVFVASFCGLSRVSFVRATDRWRTQRFDWLVHHRFSSFFATCSENSLQISVNHHASHMYRHHARARACHVIALRNCARPGS